MGKKPTTIRIDEKYIELMDSIIEADPTKSYGKIIEKTFDFWLEVKGENRIKKFIKKRSDLLKELWTVRK